MILTPNEAISHIAMAGPSATLKGKERSFRYIFQKVRTITRVSTISDDGFIIHIGYISTGASCPTLLPGIKGRPHEPAYKALAWYLDRAFNNPEAAMQAEFTCD